MKDTCEDFEIAIDQRTEGAVLPEPTRLDAHLTTCAACRAYQRSVLATRSAMQATARAELSAVDWAALRDGLRVRVARDGRLRMSLLGVLAGAQTITILVYNLGKPSKGLWTHLGMSALAILAVWLVGRLDARRARGYERSAGDILFFQRAWVESRLRSTWLGSLAATGIAALFVGDRLLRLFTAGHGYSVAEWIGGFGMAGFLLAFAAWLSFVRRPRLVRELAAYRA